MCANAADDNQNGLIDEGCGLSLGLVQFLAGWSAAKADVDLRVVDPNGELIEVGRVARSGLTKDRDCPGRGTECQGKNLENVYLAEASDEKSWTWRREGKNARKAYKSPELAKSVVSSVNSTLRENANRRPRVKSKS